ncbi:MAG: hypothetical protein Q9159_005736 [Coniocarpon cinnabarinum]
MPGARHGSAFGSAGGALDSPRTKLRDVTNNDSAAGADEALSPRVPHSQSFSNASLRSNNDTAGAKERSRAGFLKRMFTSNRTSSLSDLRNQAPQLPPLETQTQKDDRRSQALQEHEATKSSGVASQTPPEPPAPSEEPSTPQRPPQLRSKRSFFQRRRKSVSQQDVPDMPSHPPPPAPSAGQHSNRPSTSSLRQVMNPWISGPSSPRRRPPEEVERDSLDEVPHPHRRAPETQDAYEFLRTTAPPGWVGQSQPGTQLPPRGGHKAIPTSPNTARSRPADSPLPSGGADDADMKLGESPASAAMTKALRRRSATSPAAQSRAADAAKAGNDSAAKTASTAMVQNESSRPDHLQNRDADASPAHVTSRDRDAWLLSDTQPAQVKHSPKPQARVWIEPNDSDEETPVQQNVDTDDRPISPRVDIHAPPEVSPTQDDFISARSVPGVHLEDYDEDDPVSPLTRPEEVDFPVRKESYALLQEDKAQEHAREIFEAQNNRDLREQGLIELGEPGENGNRLRAAFMSFFDFAGLNILLALRDLCARMTLKGETQQMDRIVGAFARRWCESNPNHGFKSTDVVHTICYSLVLLNTDLHVADLTDKMTRNQFVRNTVPTLRRLAEVESESPDATIKAKPQPQRGSIPFATDRPTSPMETDTRLSADDRPAFSRMSTKLSLRPTSEIPSIASPSPYDNHRVDPSELLVNSPFEGDMKGWENTLETVLKEYYLSIRQLRLPLHGADESSLNEQPSTSSLSVMTNLMRRTGSVISRAPSEDSRGRAANFRAAASRFASKNRSRPRLYPTSTLGSSRTASRTSLEDNNVWSPSASSFTSQGKTLTTMSTDSLSSRLPPPEMGYQQSIGFANALSHVIIREESSSIFDRDAETDASLLDDDSLELAGAPWAKEGIVQHKHHLEGDGKKSKDRNWSECFAVIQRGSMRLFSFAGKGSTRSQKKNAPKAGGVVGGGNWLENAENLASFTLRHTIANVLPSPGYSKQRPNVFALSLPNGSVHLFHVGTAEIAQEFVVTANYWSARLSKEPLVGGVSNVEYGWGESVINTALIGTASTADANTNAANRTNPAQPPSSFHLPRAESSLSNSATPNGRNSGSGNRSLHSPTPSSSFSIQGGVSSGPSNERVNSMHRPSISGSLRSSFDAPRQAAYRNRLPADRLVLGSWQPPQQSLMPSHLPEAEQLAALKAYVASVEDDLAKHNELRPALALAFTPRSVNAGRAMGNWERKSHYLLREIVKFRTYVDVLELAAARRKEVNGETTTSTTTKEDKRGTDPASKEAKETVRVVTEKASEDEELSAETLEALRGAQKREQEV